MKPIPTAIFTLILVASCTQEVSFNEEQALSEILHLHHSQRDHHFGKDSISFVQQLAHNFASVNAGVISFPSKKATLSRYHRYFSSVDFRRWDDVQEPIIRFSDDFSLAYTIVEKLVELEYENEYGEVSLDSTHFAWIAIYRNTHDGWKIESVVSTNKP